MIKCCFVHKYACVSMGEGGVKEGYVCHKFGNWPAWDLSDGKFKRCNNNMFKLEL